MVEIENGVLRGQCLHRRIGDRAILEREIIAWERRRNLHCARVNGMFTPEKARAKMAKIYPALIPSQQPGRRVKTTVQRQ